MTLENLIKEVTSIIGCQKTSDWDCRGYNSCEDCPHNHIGYGDVLPHIKKYLEELKACRDTAYSKHTFEFTDIDCLILSDALSYLAMDKVRHPIDRRSASQIKDKIFETVKRDKELNNENP